MTGKLTRRGAITQLPTDPASAGSGIAWLSCLACQSSLHRHGVGGGDQGCQGVELGTFSAASRDELGVGWSVAVQFRWGVINSLNGAGGRSGRLRSSAGFAF